MRVAVDGCLLALPCRHPPPYIRPSTAADGDDAAEDVEAVALFSSYHPNESSMTSPTSPARHDEADAAVLSAERCNTFAAANEGVVAAAAAVVVVRNEVAAAAVALDGNL